MKKKLNKIWASIELPTKSPYRAKRFNDSNLYVLKTKDDRFGIRYI